MAIPLPKNDPARWLLEDKTIFSVPNKDIYDETCYICRDPEFAQMGLPLCFACEYCGGHVAADDSICKNCNLDHSDPDDVIKARELKEEEKNVREENS